MRTLLIDNNDSFTENLAQLIRSLGAECEVVSSAKLTVQQVKNRRPDRIVISAGPGHPKYAKLCNELLRSYAQPSSPTLIPLLGVCLGHQCIAHVFGCTCPTSPAGYAGHTSHSKKKEELWLATRSPTHGAKCGGRSSIGHAPEVRHGKTSEIFHEGKGILKGLPSPFDAARYHSLMVQKLPKDFELLCWTGSQKKPDLIMGMRHRILPIVGVQFHPESFLTEHGEKLMKNFLHGL